ncbi:LysM peptidoglycan-binding domain-containing protein [Biomaibacter acetigenes]|uniref:LysM peptidoglycan-binding domain-containing protein n=1 Tax=Biomaibacter acetigenes TaxID=2316383 RepID=A0A3G2R3W8_9FIRM|nr:LysM peptidoglycan-binding domain-containing protein [Biomaibacter acetigenes]AYO29818.1 LysM peptidoglycan-binding domain-containing protein [Biomaibacter acetigenes]RKL64434.1 LysM peptidoglycan-binding domain-containing protein [Thermoanaerobacteraceae bacterium SP2]
MQLFKKLNIAAFAVTFFLLLGGTAQAQVYTVQPGDTLFLLSKSTGVPMEKIVSANTLANDQILAGQVLLLPEKYIVKSGDTLYLISRRYGIDLQELKSLNGLSSDEIFVGQALYIPQKSPYRRITVQKGDTLFLISRAYGVTVQDLKDLNGLIGDDIYPGMRLLIPHSAQVPATAPERSGELPSRGYIDRDAYVKSSSGIYYTAEDRMVLAKLIHAEAEGEPYDGKVAVGAVVVNRVKSPDFPNTIKDVVYQIDELGLYQFSPVEEGRLDYITPNKDSLSAADDALAGVDPTGGALYFFNPAKISNKWLLSKPVLYKIGNHVFTK